jgi:hypothetical protein
MWCALVLMGRRPLLAAAFVLGIHTPAIAGWILGNDLWSVCKTPPFDECMAYILGAFDTYQAAAVVPTANLPSLCEPKGLTSYHLRDIVIKHLKDNPKERHLGGPLLVLDAINEAYPCPKE